MDRSLIAVLVAAAASMVVAAIGLFTAIITNRRLAENARSIELLKLSLARQAKAKEFADAALSDALDSLREGIRAVQNLKDEIQLILSSREDSFESQEAISRLHRARDSLLATYQERLSHLSSAEDKALHDAKDIVLKICSTVQNSLRGRMYVSPLAENTRAALVDFRSRLTDKQNVLRDSRADRMAKRTFDRE